MGAIFLTGATGQVGGATARLLIERDADVRLGVRDLDRAEALGLNPRYCTTFDYTRPETYATAFEGIDTLFLVTPPADTQADRTVIPAVKAAMEAGVERFVVHTAMGVDLDDNLPMRRIERFVEDTGRCYTHIRPNWFMNNTLSWLAGGIKNGDIFLPAGEGKTSFIDVQNIAQVAARALTQPGHHGKAYTLTGPEALSYHDVASILSEALGRLVRYTPISDEQAQTAFTSMGYSDQAAAFMLNLFAVVREGYTAPITDTVKTVTGRDPTRFMQFAYANRKAWE